MPSNQLNIPILYQDDSFAVVSKPSGLLVHRTCESQDRVYLLQTLSRQLDKYVYPIHRLDRATSGLIVFAFSSEDAAALATQLQQGNWHKEYIAFVRRATPTSWESNRTLTSDKKVRQVAHTQFERLATFFRSSLIKAIPSTGRRHQIRRHLAHDAHQIIGDTSYGKGRINQFFRENYGLPRLFLHAWHLEFPHPKTGQIIRLVDPLPEDLRQFLLRLPECPKELINTL